MIFICRLKLISEYQNLNNLLIVWFLGGDGGPKSGHVTLSPLVPITFSFLY